MHVLLEDERIIYIYLTYVIMMQGAKEKSK